MTSSTTPRKVRTSFMGFLFEFEKILYVIPVREPTGPGRKPRQRQASPAGPESVATVGDCRLARDHTTPSVHQLISPDGQISWCFAKLPVQPDLQKYFRFRLTQITSISLPVSSHRGAIARRHERGAGCGGREGVSAQGNRRAR